MRYADACLVFELKPGQVTWDRVRTLYRHAARLVHPDRGGTRDAWDTLQEAYHRIWIELAKPRLCPACRGTKHRVRIVKFVPIKNPCETCAGTGSLPPEAPEFRKDLDP